METATVDSKVTRACFDAYVDSKISWLFNALAAKYFGMAGAPYAFKKSGLCLESPVRSIKLLPTIENWLNGANYTNKSMRFGINQFIRIDMNSSTVYNGTVFIGKVPYKNKAQLKPNDAVTLSVVFTLQGKQIFILSDFEHMKMQDIADSVIKTINTYYHID